MANENISLAQFMKGRMNASYFRSIPGLLKLSQLVASLIGVIISAFAGYSDWSGLKVFESTFGISWTITILLCLFYLFKVVYAIFSGYWNLFECVYCTIVAILFAVSSSMLASNAPASPVLGGGAFFGFVSTILYGIDAYLKFRSIGQMPDGAPEDQASQNNPV